MSLLYLIALQAISDEILVTASRAPADRAEIGVTSTIIDEQRIEATGSTQATDLLRLVPGVSVSTAGSRGAQAQVRIRGAEANHSLVFVDGIQLNDVAAGNEARFETLLADGIGRIEVVRGPQSAIWGSEAIGGVIALTSPAPHPGLRVSAMGEYGGQETMRAAGMVSGGAERLGATLTIAHAESEGIDMLGGGTGDRDGFHNLTLGFRGAFRADGNEFGVTARYVDAYNAFDGTDPITFLRADTAESSATKTRAVRAYASLGADRAGPWTFTLGGQYLDSRNRNFDGGAPLNRTAGDRFRTTGQIERRVDLGNTRHVLIASGEAEQETYSARGQQYFGATDQDRQRERTAFVGEWRAEWASFLTTDIALRHDDFDWFDDATNFRAAAIGQLGAGFSLIVSYGEGIAQPTFVDLFGFFPGSFVGNAALRPERSRGVEIGARWEGEAADLSISAFNTQLEDEIISVFDSTTFLSSTANATGRSKRQGIELEANVRPAPGLRLSGAYTYLDASDQQTAGGLGLREVRRPENSASLSFDYERGPLILGGSLVYVGDRRDTDFDIFQDVTLEDYVLGALRVGYRLTPAVELFARADNLFDADYQDVVGYATPGRSLHAGLRLRLGD